MKLEGRDWYPTYTLIPRKNAVVDLDVVPKGWTYFLHHTLDTNISGHELIAMGSLALYMLLPRQWVNIGHIIFTDVDEMA